MNTAPKADRYEYRVFSDDLTAIAQEIEARGRLVEQTCSTEVYIVTRLNIESSLKIRDQRLELKTLAAREGLLELWHPEVAADLPVPSALVVDTVAPALGVVVEFQNSRLLDAKEILDIARADPQLAPVAVDKSRRRYEIDGGLAEIVHVVVGDHAMKSAAVESEDVARAEALARRVHLEEEINTSYPALLQKLLFS